MIMNTLSLELKVDLEITHLKYSNNHSADKAFNTLTYFENLYINTLEICKYILHVASGDQQGGSVTWTHPKISDKSACLNDG